MNNVTHKKITVFLLDIKQFHQTFSLTIKQKIQLQTAAF